MSRFDTNHPQYDFFSYKWVRQRDVMAGEDMVKSKGIIYLPALETHNETGYVQMPLTRPGSGDGPGAVPTTVNQRASSGADSYDSYLGRATFLNASKRTAEGLHGAIFSKDPKITYPNAAELEDCGIRAESFDEVLGSVAEDLIKIGRVGVLVDSMASDDEDSDPYMALYQAEDIVDWKEQRRKGRMVKTYVRLREARMERREPHLPYEEVIRYRELVFGPLPDIVAMQEDGIGGHGRISVEGAHIDTGVASATDSVYYQMIWRVEEAMTGAEGEEASTDRREVLESMVVPQGTGGTTFDAIPFVIFNPTSRTMKPESPATEDLVIHNLSHYKNSADLEHGLHLTAIPQAWLSGFDFPQGTVLNVGGAAWWTPTPGGTAGYLEFEGAGLGAIESRMETKRREMAMLGARMLEEQPRQGAEAERTLRLRRESDRTSLADIAKNISRGMTEVLEFWALWHGRKGADVACMLNEDYGTEGIDPQIMQNLLLSVQDGVMSWATFFWNLKRGGLIPQDVDETAERARIQTGQNELGIVSQEDRLEVENQPQGQVSPDSNGEADPEVDPDEEEEDDDVDE